MDRSRSRLCFVVLVLAGSVYPQSPGPVFPNPGKAPMSKDQQRALGLQAAAQVYQQMPVLPDNSPETQYIRQLGQKLVATIPPQYSWPFEFHVVAQKDINAFALPGGPMFVNIGTITAAANEAQLAGVMAHEMSHVYMQHSAKQQKKAEWTSGIAAVAGGVLGATTHGTVAQLAQSGIQFGAQGLILKYSRSDEAQADALGAVILYKASYNPVALAQFFKTLETQGGQAPPQWLSDHPNPGNREQAIQKQIANWPSENYAGDSVAFQKARQHALGVKAYTGEEIAAGAKSGQWAAQNKKQGAVFNASAFNAGEVTASAPVPAASIERITPNQRMVVTDLGLMKISRPENWAVTMPKRQGDYVTIAPQAGVTSKGVGYGVLINAGKARAANIDAVETALVQQLQKADGLTPAGHAEAIRVNGVEGRMLMMRSASPFPSKNGQPQPEDDWLVVLPHSGDVVIFFVFVAPQSEFATFRPTYEAMLKSVRF